MTLTLSQLNALPLPAACEHFEHCCGARAWTKTMAGSRPFADTAALHAAADGALDRLTRADWLEAFAAHPRIGGEAASAWSRQEQAGAADADAELLQALRSANDRYFERFGFIFLICATGKSASDMLAVLQARLANAPEVEFDVATGQQRLITHLRIDKLLGS